MTAYDGVLVLGSESSADDKTVSAIANREFDYPIEYGLVDTSLALWGVWGNEFPVSMPENAWGGVIVPGYLYDYYFRFHVWPATFREYILVETERSFTIWNAFIDDDGVCTDIDVDYPDELEVVTGTGDIPYTLYSLWVWTLDFVIPVEGSVKITVVIALNFGALGIPDVDVEITRLAVFPWEFLVPMKEQLVYGTQVTPSRDGTEQRISHRPVPRQAIIGKTYYDNEHNQSMLDTVLARWHKRSFGVPMWQYAIVVEGTITADDDEILMDTAYADYRDASLAIIWQETTGYEIVTIATVESDRLTLESPVQATWIGVKWIMPLRVAFLRPNIERPAYPGGYGYLNSHFLIVDNDQITGYVAPQTYKGRPVLTTPSIVEDDETVQQDSDAVFVDYDLHEFTMLSDSDENIVVIPHTFRIEGRQECWEFRQFLDYIRGKQGSFWRPTFKNDLTLMEQVSVDATSITITLLSRFLTGLFLCEK
jgi:hypothetical protein